ncbi:MAG: aminopeptidase [Caldisericia bacterium]|nr:aminopeptidase [Caldisericia bacterium]
MEGLNYKEKNVWEVYNEKEIEEISKDYVLFMSRVKTEREFVKEAEKLLKQKGFSNIDEKGVQSDKLYRKFKEKSIIIFLKGKRRIEEGFNLITAHLDSPRIDLKQKPLYEEGKLAFFETHYYGGIKKYQWATIPLVLRGVIVKEDGSILEINTENDGYFFTIPDLLPHLGRKQMEKKAKEVIPGENLNLLVGSKPLKDEKEEKIKKNILSILNELYGIKEEDFISSELSLVPAGEAREVGFDKSFILSYGHDDRICSYAALRGILDIDKPEKWAIVYLVDKEEIGSEGNTSAQSMFFEETLLKFVKDYSKLLSIYLKSSVLSGDVNAAFDPNYKEVFEPKNTAFINQGVVITKFTGSGGKYHSNDATAEYVGKVRKLFNEEKVVWQTGELGKVDEGGGGTVALFFARKGMDVIDCGPAVLSMHAPFEVASKGDLYATFHGYRVFLEKF